MRTVQLGPLKLLRRIVWRLEHLALPEVLGGLPGGASVVPPPPLPLLASALTHKNAQAESPEPPPTEGQVADLARANAKGCCEYEQLEWFGDAALDPVAKLAVMAKPLHAQHSERELNPEAERLLDNRNLYGRAVALGLADVDLRALPAAGEAAGAPQISRHASDAGRHRRGAHRRDVPRAARGGAAGRAGALDRGLDAAKGFSTPTCTAGGRAGGQRGVAGVVAQIDRSMAVASEPEHRDDALAELIAAGLLPSSVITRRRDRRTALPVEQARAVPAARVAGRHGAQVSRLGRLRDRHPDKKEGELDCLRTALVSNLHQARLLTRRFGRETTRRFFDDIGKAEQRAAISKFIDEVSRDEVPHLDALWALEAARARGEGGARGVVSSAGAATTCKPMGDVYEALLGLVLLELGGSVDATWRVFKADFREGADDAEETSPTRSRRRGGRRWSARCAPRRRGSSRRSRGWRTGRVGGRAGKRASSASVVAPSPRDRPSRCR